MTFTFYLANTATEETRLGKEVIARIPRTTGIYALKGMVGRLLELKAMHLRLMWETGEWDPVAGGDDSEESEDEGEEADGGGEDRKEKGKGRWVQREEELVDGMKDVGFWIEGREARVRVELR